MRQSSGAVLACSVTLKLAGKYLAMVLYLQSEVITLLYSGGLQFCFTKPFLLTSFIIKGWVIPEIHKLMTYFGVFPLKL